jgi:murein DD-endopeptidase MepM/ murein hydrolase activator NlpD
VACLRPSTKLAALAALLVIATSVGLWAHRSHAEHVPQAATQSRGWQPHPARGAASGSAGSTPEATLGGREPAPVQPSPGVEPEEADVVSGSHLGSDGVWSEYVHIPLRAGRPRSYQAYRWPLRLAHGSVLSGYDLDLPSELQRRIPGSGEVGHGAVDIAAEYGTSLRLVALEQQVEDPRVLYVGPLFGLTVATVHVVEELSGLRRYIVLLGHLSATPAAVRRGVRLRGAWQLGSVGDSGCGGNVHLHLETRRVRRSVDPWQLEPEALVDPANTVVCDPRNVLPLRPGYHSSESGAPSL